MFKETKEDLFSDLEDMVKIMNKEDFWIGPRDIRRRENINNRHGSIKVREILKRHKVTTLCELTKKQLQDEIILIHQSVMKGM